jgi:hypothetical protein
VTSTHYLEAFHIIMYFPFSTPQSANNAYLPVSLLSASGDEGHVFFAVARESLAAEPMPIVALKVLKKEAKIKFARRQSSLLADLKEMQEKDD